MQTRGLDDTDSGWQGWNWTLDLLAHPDGRFALGEQQRKIRRPSQWGWIWEEEGVTGNPQMCQISVLREHDLLQFARLVVSVWWVWTSCCHPQAAEPVQSCCALTDISRHCCLEGKMLLICIGSSPNNLRFTGRPRGEESRLAPGPRSAVSTWGPPPFSYLSYDS